MSEAKPHCHRGARIPFITEGLELSCQQLAGSRLVRLTAAERNNLLSIKELLKYITFDDKPAKVPSSTIDSLGKCW